MTHSIDAPTWTRAQAAAIDARGRTLVTAAAGSGKTSVLTELVARRLLTGELGPAEVCAVTFTEKAAQEMRGRIASRLAAAGRHDLLAELELARIGTIHSLCSWILRQHGAAIGVAPDAHILDDAQSAFVRSEARRAIMDGPVGQDEDVHWLRVRMGDQRIASTLDSIFDLAATSTSPIRLVSPHDVEAPLTRATARKPPEVVVPLDECRRSLRALDHLWRAYADDVARRRRALGRLSFDDLERLAVEAVRVDEVATALRARWSIVLVDEFQDTNERQYELLDTVGGDHLFMVGDEWQSIYGFRGADIDVFRERKAEVQVRGRGIEMLENFRSAGPILDVVNRVFGAPDLFAGYRDVVPGTDAQREETGPRVELLVVPAHDEGGSTDGVETSSEFEAARVAERIAELVESGDATPGDIAVLYRTRTHAAVYERAIAAWGIPVLRTASDGYYDQRDVRDALALLQLLRNRADDGATLAALAGPVGALSWNELDELVQEARERGTSLLQAAGSSELRGARRLCTVLTDLEHALEREPLVRVVSRVVQLPELEVGAAGRVDGAVRLANLRRLVELAASAAEVGVADVAGLLEFVEAQRRGAKVGEANVADETLGAVRLLTVHASKGLEFPYVFVVEAGGRATPPAGAVPDPLVDDDGVVHVALPGRDGRPRRTPAHEALHERRQQAEDAEQRRLWYVAVTRAERRLVISGRWDFTPRSDGSPRAVTGHLCWLAPAFGAAAPFGGQGARSTLLDGAVLLDTRPATRPPEPVWTQPIGRASLGVPLQLPLGADSGPTERDHPAVDPHALRERLRADVGGVGAGQEWRQLDGTRLHDAVARLLDAARSGVTLDALLDPEQGPWLTEHVRARLAPVVGGSVFGRLAQLGARSEVPYVAGTGGVVASRVAPGVSIARQLADVDAGRFDALARLPAGGWWVVDWKTTLPDNAADAWALHGRQLERYARTLLATGAPDVVVTLASITHPGDARSWRLETAGAALARTLVQVP